MSKVIALYHIVFATKRREMTIPDSGAESLYRFIWSIIREHKCRLLRIGGIENHVHILLDLHPSVALSDIVREIKSRSSSWMCTSGLFPHFCGWASEYFAISVSNSVKEGVVRYINEQKTHHQYHNFADELTRLYAAAGKTLDANDMM
ncbi:MAG: IS200/IS605 family transposase [Muribaculaceae bacterium]|nr:IS200/IS605 family transposase [Muribaculaceae bacterium]